MDKPAQQNVIMLQNFKACFIEIYYKLIERKQSGELVFTPADLGFAVRDQSPEDYYKRINSIMALLRKTPYWSRGQLRLGWMALEVKEVGLAFSSFTAVLCLKTKKGSNNQLEFAAMVGLAKCCLSRGAYEQAIKQLLELPESWLSHVYVQEQLVACYMALESYDRVRAVIEKIPEDSRSPQILEVQNYIRALPI